MAQIIVLRAAHQVTLTQIFPLFLQGSATLHALIIVLSPLRLVFSLAPLLFSTYITIEHQKNVLVHVLASPSIIHQSALQHALQLTHMLIQQQEFATLSVHQS
jgi:hypothetical protein